MNREDYLKLLAGDVTIALEICEKADEWCDTDPVGLYHAAQVLARHYKAAKEDVLEHCETCQNSEWADECWRGKVRRGEGD